MRILAFAVALLASGIAIATEALPIIDVERNCEFPGGIKVTRQSYNACIDREQKYYDLAKRVFIDLDDSVKTNCREEIEKYNQGYHVLYGCYYARQSMLDAARSRERERQSPPHRFRY